MICSLLAPCCVDFDLFCRKEFSFDPTTLEPDICKVDLEVGPSVAFLYGTLIRNFMHVKEKLSAFDLKGSIINREVHMPFTMKNCLKDVNLLTISKEEKFLRFQRDDMRTICM